jgi:hypothetical protein
MDRETLDFDVVFVGAGPANLSSAYHLARLVKNYNEEISKGTQKDRSDREGRHCWCAHSLWRRHGSESVERVNP